MIVSFKFVTLFLYCLAATEITSGSVTPAIAPESCEYINIWKPAYQSLHLRKFILSEKKYSGKKHDHLLLLHRLKTKDAPKVVFLPDPRHGPDQTLRFSNTVSEHFSVMIINAYGRLLYWRNFYQPSGLVRIRTGLPAGSYTLVVEGQQVHLTEKIIVTR